MKTLNWKHLLVVSCFGLVNSEAHSQWLTSLPAAARESVLWSADHEEGDLSDWTFPASKDAGGGILNTGDNDVSASCSEGFVHSGRYAAKASISKAVRAQNGNKAVRMVRWTDRPWEQGGKTFPVEAYYSTWMFIPTSYNPNKYPPWDPGDGGWWNVFQFKSHDEKGESHPTWALNIEHNDAKKEMSFYMYSAINSPNSFLQRNPKPIPVQRWFHIEARCRKSWKNEGSITVWQDGEQILDIHGINTLVSSKDDQIVWGIGNYTDHIAGGTVEGEATLFFDDCAVSSKPLSPFAIPKAVPQERAAKPSFVPE